MLAAVTHHPLPIQGGRHKASAFSAVPGQGPEAAHFLKREGDVASVANDVQKKRVWDASLQSFDVKNIVGIVQGPALGRLGLRRRNP